MQQIYKCRVPMDP